MSHSSRPSSFEYFNETESIARLDAFNGLVGLLQKTFPMMADQFGEITARYQKTCTEAAEHAFQMQLHGEGERATYLRRMFPGVKEVEDRIRAQLPVRLSSDRAQPKTYYLGHIERLFADALPAATKGAIWAQFAPSTPVPYEAVKNSPGGLTTGIYGMEGNDRAIVVDMVSPDQINRTVLVFEEANPEPIIWTYVPLEEIWIKHSVFEFVNPDLFGKVLGDFMGIPHDLIPQDKGEWSLRDVSGMVKLQLETMPIDETDKSVWQAREDVLRSARPGLEQPVVLAWRSSPVNPECQSLIFGTYGCKLRFYWSPNEEECTVSFNHPHYSVWEEFPRASRYRLVKLLLDTIEQRYEEEKKHVAEILSKVHPIAANDSDAGQPDEAAT